jgi:hypothetical protein
MLSDGIGMRFNPRPFRSDAMKVAIALLAFASLFSPIALAQDSSTAETVTGAPAPICTPDSLELACAQAGQFKPTYEIQREFDGYYTGFDPRP